MSTSSEERFVAACGLVCSECPAYIATQAGNEKRIAEVAEQWSREFNADIPAAAVWCDGCLREGRKCGHCAECEVRTCVTGRGLPNCGLCSELESCAIIAKFFEMVPHAKAVIESIAGKA